MIYLSSSLLLLIIGSIIGSIIYLGGFRWFDRLLLDEELEPDEEDELDEPDEDEELESLLYLYVLFLSICLIPPYSFSCCFAFKSIYINLNETNDAKQNKKTTILKKSKKKSKGKEENEFLSILSHEILQFSFT